MAAKAEAQPSVEDFRHGRVPREVRERQVLALAEDLFTERGYEGASMEELSRRAGVSKPVIYDLVGSKEALFRRCFERSGEELAVRMAAVATEHAGDLADELRTTARAFFRFIEEHESAWAMLFSLDTGGRTAAAVAEIRARQAQFAAARITQAAADRGKPLDPLRASAAAACINGCYEALAHWRRDHPEVGADELADRLVEFALPGVEALVG
jgi:AcrR family transcriptional regulator